MLLVLRRIWIRLSDCVLASNLAIYALNLQLAPPEFGMLLLAAAAAAACVV
jgi:hypothetical protein